ncbi:FHAD1 protein, partial [Aegithalos caudatus]|nr:FHAD1 protein [Aegithalos caudatus]
NAALEFSASGNSFILQDFNSPHGTFVSSCQVRLGGILSFGTAGASFQLGVDGAARVGLGMPGKGAQGRVGGDVPGKVPRRGSWVGVAAQGRLQKQKLA